MESQPLAYILQKSKKRVFPGGSSSCMDPDVVEISPPINLSSKSRSRKQKEVIHHEVIDVDMDDDCGEVLLLGGKVDTNSKGKEAMVNFSSKPSGAVKLGSMDGVDSSMKSSALGLDSFSSDFSCNDDYMDIYYDDFIYDDDYTILQSHFDNIDIPSGVEAPIPWLPGPAQNASMPATEPVQLSSRSSSTSCSKMDHVLPQSGLLPEFAQSKKNVVGPNIPTYSSSQTQRGDVNIPSGPKRHSESSHGKWKSVVSTSSNSSHEQLGGMQLYPPLTQPISASNYSNSKKKHVGSASPYSTPHFPLAPPFPPPPPPHFPMVTPNPPLGGKTPLNWKYEDFRSMHKQNLGNSAPPYLGAVNPFPPPVHVPHVRKSRVPPVSSSNFHKYGDEEEILKKFQVFKKFDTVEDHSDHHYVGSVYSVKQPSKNWAKKIQDEWRILEKDLPDTIFVRVYESRMDLLRAVIVGAEGTPYHDGLFFFDVYFPSSYPNVPPHVYYHSGGLRINPNLYNEGKVCLSLLNTWSGGQREKWLPGVSTMLQVLVSIQGLILNAKPYFNEPGYAHSSGSVNGEKCSLQYNEDTFIKSLTTMVYSIRRPPKHFEDLVAGHFLTRAHDILVACKAYMDGAQVGCLVRGGVQDVDEGDKSCSQGFKQTLSAQLVIVVEAFKQVGAKDCDKFLLAAQS